VCVCVCLVELYAGEFQYASSPPPVYTSLVQSPIITHQHYDDTSSHHTAGAMYQACPSVCVCVCLAELYAGEFQYASSPPPVYTSLVQSPIITHQHYDDTPSHHTAGARALAAAVTDALGGGGCSESSAPVDVDGSAAPPAMRAGGWSNPPSYRSRDPAARPLSQSALTPPPRYHHSPGAPVSPGSPDDDELTAVSPAAAAASP